MHVRVHCTTYACTYMYIMLLLPIQYNHIHVSILVYMNLAVTAPICAIAPFLVATDFPKVYMLVTAQVVSVMLWGILFAITMETMFLLTALPILGLLYFFVRT